MIRFVRSAWVLGALILVVAACAPSQEDDTLPTLAVLPSVTPTIAPTQTPSETPRPTLTYTPTDLPTLTPSNTPSPTNTATVTPEFSDEDLEEQAQMTATAAILQAPVFATLTPIPPGVNVIVRPTSTGTPLVAADVIITQQQFQDEVDRVIAGSANVERATVRLINGGVDVELTALAGQAFTTGTLRIYFDLLGQPGGLNNVLVIRPAPYEEFRMIGGGEAPDAFVDVAYSELVPLVFEAFSDILNRRLGEGRHDLEYIQIDGGIMALTLLVPERSG